MTLNQYIRRHTKLRGTKLSCVVKEEDVVLVLSLCRNMRVIRLLLRLVIPVLDMLYLVMDGLLPL